MKPEGRNNMPRRYWLRATVRVAAGKTNPARGPSARAGFNPRWMHGGWGPLNRKSVRGVAQLRSSLR
jgi:hypothetical protein